MLDRINPSLPTVNPTLPIGSITWLPGFKTALAIKDDHHRGISYYEFILLNQSH